MTDRYKPHLFLHLIAPTDKLLFLVSYENDAYIKTIFFRGQFFL